MTYPDGNNARVSNYIKIIGKEHVVFILQEDYKIIQEIDRDQKDNMQQKKLL